MLLFLLLPSCIVAPIENIANKFIFPIILSSSTTSLNPQAVLPTMNNISNMGMDKSTGINPVNNFKPRGRSTSIERNIKRQFYVLNLLLSCLPRKSHNE